MKNSKDSSAKRYQQKRKRINKIARERYEDKKLEYGCKQFKNLSEDGEQYLVECRNIYYKVWKNKTKEKVINVLSACVKLFFKDFCFR